MRRDVRQLREAAQLGEEEIQAIVREIQKHPIRVLLRTAGREEKDLGHISGFTIEVFRDPLERTIEAFTICHMFGHMVQFTSPHRYRQLLESVSETPPIQLSEHFWNEFYDYEREAYGFGATVLENAISTDEALRSKYANFMEVDFRHYRKYVTTGKQPSRPEYRAKLVRRYVSHPTTVPITPVSFSNVRWADLATPEATIY